jgi:predicted RNase H-like HicB family nuclease
MRRVRVQFQHDVDWRATSPDMPGYYALAPTEETLRALVHEGVEFYFDDGAPFEVVEEHVTATAV